MRRATAFVSNLLAACAATALLTSPAHATNYVFTESGFADGATLSGSFTATDANGSGAIEYNAGDPTDQDVTAFSATFSGNSALGAFQLDFQDLVGLYYDPAGVYVYPGYIELLAGSATNAVAINLFAYCTGSNICGIVVNSQGTGDGSIELPTVTAVPTPEPATWAMMLLGFGMVGAALRASRRIAGKRYAPALA